MPLALSYGIGLIALLAGVGVAARDTRAPRGIVQPQSLRRVLPERVNELGAYSLAPVFTAGEWRAIVDGGIPMEVYRPSEVTISHREVRRRVIGARVSLGFLRLTGAVLRGGRLPEPGTDDCVLSERVARALVGEPRAAVGTRIRIDGRERTVAGVLDSRFLGVDQRGVDVWQRLSDVTERGVASFELSGLVRLPASLAPERVAERIALILAASGSHVRSVGIVPLSDDRLGDASMSRRAVPFVLLLCAVVAALGIANCWLILRSGEWRQRPGLRMRHVLGAPLSRLIAAVASGPLTALGAGTVLALTVLSWGRKLVSALGAEYAEWAPESDAQIVGASGVALVAAIVGLAAHTHRAIAGVAGSVPEVSRHRRPRTFVIAAYLGAVSALAVASVPIAAASIAVARARPGFDARHVVVITALTDPGARAPSLMQIRGAVSALERVPHASAVAASTGAPFRAVTTETVARGAGNFAPQAAHVYRTIGDVAAALGLGESGRRAGDRAGLHGGVLVTQALADRWGVEPGHCIYVDGDVCSPVLAVTADVSSIALGETPFPTVFAEMRSAPPSGRVHFLVRFPRDPANPEMNAVERAVAEELPTASVNVERLTDVVRERTAPLRAIRGVCAVLLGLAATLGLVGVRASTELTVATRRRELGMRAALGASRAQLLTAVTSDATVSGAVAMALGLGLGLVASRLLASVVTGLGGAQLAWQIGLGFAAPGLMVVTSLATAYRATAREPAALLFDHLR